jgi:hypothetical protein
MAFIVIESTPGYMPENDDPFVTDSYEDAVAHAHELANELEDQGYVCDRSWASGGNYLAIHCELPRGETVAPDLGRNISIENAEE